MECIICNNKNLYKFLSLGHQPPSDAFLKKEDLNKPEIYYPLDVYFCETCGLVQLGYSVDPEILFRDYVYNTSTNNSLIKNFNELTKKLVERFRLTKDDLAIDIGSNDGTLLEGYSKFKVKVLGVEPSDVAKIAIKKNIPTINDFFNREVAERIAKTHGKAKVITATNVFAHVNEFSSLMEGIKDLLSDGGVFVQESHYLMDLLDGMQWDSIYHEHLRNYSLGALNYIFEKFGMEVFDAERITTHGGSIRTYSCKKGEYVISNNVKKLLNQEKESGLYDKRRYEEFGKKVFAHKMEIQDMLLHIRKAGKRIVGIGAPAKGNTLLNYCHIDSDILSYIVEKSELKIGKFTPGMHIPVVEEKVLFDKQPEYVLLLSWNIEKELIPKIKKGGYKGKFIVPLPFPHVVD